MNAAPLSSTCPLCFEVYALDGSCSCDVDSIPPSATCAWPVRIERPTTRPDRARAATLLRLATSARLAPVDRAVTELLACSIPGPDGRSVCDACLDRLGVILQAIPAVALELNVERGAARGIDYRTLGGGTGGRKVLPLPAHVGDAESRDRDSVVRRYDDATDHGHHAPAAPLTITAGSVGARDRLRTTLWQTVNACIDAHLDHTSPRNDRPHRGDVPAMAQWLTWRIDAMPGHPLTEDAPRALALAVEHALHVIDRPATRQRLGDCPFVIACGGHLAAAEGSSIARCSGCGYETNADVLRDQRLADLMDQLLTAAEIAKLTTHLGGLTITAPRETVRKRVNLWAHRGTLATRVTLERGRGSVFRFGDAYGLLVAHEDRHVHAWSKWEPEPEQPDPAFVVMVRHCEFESCAATKTRRRPAPRGGQR